MYVVTAFGSAAAVGGDYRYPLVSGRSAFKRTHTALVSGGEKHPSLGLPLNPGPPEILYSPPSLKGRPADKLLSSPQLTGCPCKTMSSGRKDNGLSSPPSLASEKSHGKTTNLPRQQQDRYEPIKRLALVQIQPARNPNKPITPFLISDILNGAVGKKSLESGRSIVRPWDDGSSRASSADDEEEGEDLEIDVDIEKPPTGTKGKSPLDALLQMTSKTFDGLDTAGHPVDDASRRDQLSLFSKSQPPKKRGKSRTAFTNQQIYELEKRFLYQKYLTPADRDEIAQSLGLSNAQVITWFQNRRAKLKRDLEELKADVNAAKSTNGDDITEAELAEMDDMELFRKHGLKRPADDPLADTPESKRIPHPEDEEDSQQTGMETCASPASVHVPSPGPASAFATAPAQGNVGTSDSEHQLLSETDRRETESPKSNANSVSSTNG